MGERGLRVAVAALGTIALTFGGLAVLGGVALVPGVETASANVDSEMRFFAAWYAAAGVLMLRAAPRADAQPTIIRAICAVFFIAGCARLLSIIVVGRPHTFFMVLMVAELAISLLVPWQASVARRKQPTRHDPSKRGSEVELL